MAIDKKALERIRKTAERTLDILWLVEQGKTINEIVEKTGCSRQLCEYYIKATLKANKDYQTGFVTCKDKVLSLLDNELK